MVKTFLQNVCEEFVKRGHKIKVLDAYHICPGCPEKRARERRACVQEEVAPELSNKFDDKKKMCIDLQNFLE